MIWQRVNQNEVVNKVAMTEEEARAYYDSHQTEFTTPSSITLREILDQPAGRCEGHQRRRRRGRPGAGRRDSRARGRR